MPFECRCGATGWALRGWDCPWHVGRLARAVFRSQKASPSPPPTRRVHLRGRCCTPNLGGPGGTKTIYRVDVQHVVGNSSGTGIEGIGMKHPAHGLGLSGNVPGVEGGFAQGVPCAIGGLPLHGVHVLRKLAQFVSSWTPSRQLHVKRFTRGEDRGQFNARCAVQQPPMLRAMVCGSVCAINRTGLRWGARSWRWAWGCG